MSGGEPSSIKRFFLCAAVNLHIRIPVCTSAVSIYLFSKEVSSLYRALYRKYRPKDFSDVCGQPHVVTTLKNQIAEGKLSHAYLFTGSRGTGKTSCAKILAKAVNCLHSLGGDPCNECEICRGIDEETILDVTEIDAASNNGVDDIRELRDNSAFAPVSAKYRVYIIDEVHMLSGAAFNALLKTLEEPPAHILFILATTEVHKLPATILSRCQRFDFRRISPEDIADRLQHVAEKENFTLDRDAALLIARLSDGAMRDALGLLDVCSTASQNISEQTVLDCAGLSGRQYLCDLLRSCVKADTAAALGTVADLYGKSKDLGRLCSELVEYLRDIMLIKTLRKPEDLLKCSASELEDMKGIADEMTLETVLHAIDVFESANEKMRMGAARRTAVETAVIKLCRPSLDSSVDALVRRLAALEASGVAIAPVIAEPAPTVVEDTEPEMPLPEPPPAKQETAPVQDEMPAPPPAKAPKAVPAPQTVSADEKFAQWNEVLSALGRFDPLMKAVLGGSSAYIGGEEKDFLLIEITNESFRDMFNNDARHRANLKKAIASVTGRNYKIGPYNPQKVQKAPVDDPLDKFEDSIKRNGLD